MDLVYALYHYGMDFPEGYAFAPGPIAPKGEKGCWRDAEDFLEFLDQCVQDGEAGDARLEAIRMRIVVSCSSAPNIGATIKSITGTLIGRLHEDIDSFYSALDLQTEAKRIIAAEVCEFLRRPSKERLGPYIRWLRKLGGDDTIITFNYDCLLEKLVKEHNPLGHLKLHVLGVESEPEGEFPRLIKMHGSVDWKRIPDEQFQKRHLPIPFERSDDLEYAMACPEDGQILTPGGSKMTSAQNELQPLWGTAYQAIRDAEDVYILGYRIPESDATAREMIINALGAPQRQQIPQVVLGPPSFDRDRLQLLIQMVMGRCDVYNLRAEDFLDIWAAGADPPAAQPPPQSAHPSDPPTESPDQQGPPNTADGSNRTQQVPIPTEPDEGSGGFNERDN